MNEAVAAAIEEIRTTFHGDVGVTDDGEEGAYVIVEKAELGPPYRQATTWIGARITFQYPYADVYPVFVRGDLTREDGAALGEAMSQASFQGREAIQVSRRSNRLVAMVDTAAIKLQKVVEWMKTR